MSKNMEKKEARLLKFDHSEASTKRFEVMYVAMRAGFAKHAKGLEQLRICNIILDKVSNISDLVAEPQDEFRRELKSGDQELLLVGMEFGKLKAMVKDEEIGWSWRLGPHVEETIDWLDSDNIKEVGLKADSEE